MATFRDILKDEIVHPKLRKPTYLHDYMYYKLNHEVRIANKDDIEFRLAICNFMLNKGNYRDNHVISDLFKDKILNVNNVPNSKINQNIIFSSIYGNSFDEFKEYYKWDVMYMSYLGYSNEEILKKYPFIETVSRVINYTQLDLEYKSNLDIYAHLKVHSLLNTNKRLDDLMEKYFKQNHPEFKLNYTNHRFTKMIERELGVSNVNIEFLDSYPYEKSILRDRYEEIFYLNPPKSDPYLQYLDLSDYKILTLEDYKEYRSYKDNEWKIRTAIH